MARFNSLRAGREQNRKQRSGSSSGYVAVRKLRMRRASTQSSVSSHAGSSVAARECGNGKRCLGRPGSTDAYSPSIPGYMHGCGFHILAACHSLRARRKPMSVNRQGREYLQRKPPTARERKARQTVRWLTPLSSGKRARQLLQIHFVLVIMFGSRPEPVVCLSFLVSCQD